MRKTILMGSILALLTCNAMAKSKQTSMVDIDTAKLDAYMHELASKDEFSGTLLLAKGEEVLYSGAFGLASKRFNVHNNKDTKFNLGSMNKMFTSVAIMQLVEKGKLSLSDKLGKHLDDTWLPKSISDQIEIQHLLSHSSGLGSYFNRDFITSARERFRSLDDFKKLIQNEKLKFKPGERFSYSNTGMLLLGVVIESVTKQSYFDYIQQNIYDRVGMTNTGSFDMDHPIPNLAIGYMQNKNQTGWKNNLFMHVIKGGPAGGGFSTIADLHKFALALTQYKLLNKQNTELLYSSKPQFNSSTYGYGFRVKGEENDRIVGHDGAFPGIDANLDIHLDKGYITVVLANYGRSAKPVINKMNELL